MKNCLYILLFLLFACKSVTPEQRFIDFVNDPANKITQKIKIGETEATLKYIPKESKEGFYYFNAKLVQPIDEKPEQARIMYLNFDMQKDFVMYIKNDSIAPAICQKIENGQKGSYEYLLAFEKPNNEENDFTVYYKDKILGIGTVAFAYDQRDIKKIPVLKN
jgi:hypothetical protein